MFQLLKFLFSSITPLVAYIAVAILCSNSHAVLLLAILPCSSIGPLAHIPEAILYTCSYICICTNGQTASSSVQTYLTMLSVWLVLSCLGTVSHPCVQDKQDSIVRTNCGRPDGPHVYTIPWCLWYLPSSVHKPTCLTYYLCAGHWQAHREHSYNALSYLIPLCRSLTSTY